MTRATAPVTEPQATPASNPGSRLSNEHPLPFKAPRVRALLAGRKTQTRRAIQSSWLRCLDPEDPADMTQVIDQCPYGQIGDRLWVREGWAVDESLDLVAHYDLSPDVDLEYLADGHRTKLRASFDRGRARSPSFMPRWASRLTLEITEVRVQRLQDICEQDARDEGIISALIPADEAGPERIGYTAVVPDDGKSILSVTPRDAYRGLWDELNVGRAGISWGDNPWVFALSFRVVP